MSEYLVEVYVSRATAASAVQPSPQDVAGVAAELTRNGTPVQLLRSIFVPEDETCFYHFEGPSDEAVLEVAARFGLQVERVVEAVSDQGVAR